MKRELNFRNAFIYFFLPAVIFAADKPTDKIVELPAPKLNGTYSIEQVIAKRRSVREFSSESLSFAQIGQLCFAAQGITDKARNLRAAPSAGSVHPMQLYIALADGLYLYEPDRHILVKKAANDIRPQLYMASFRQDVIKSSQCIFIISGNPKKIEAKYRGRGEKFLLLEAGHIAQNIELQAVAEGLASVPVGGIVSKSIAQLCKLPPTDEVVYMLPVGVPVEQIALESVSGQVSTAAPVVKSSDTADLSNSKVVIIVPDRYFDDAGFYDIRDSFSLLGIRPDVASSTTEPIIGRRNRGRLTADISINRINVADYDVIIAIGGIGGTEDSIEAAIRSIFYKANQQGKIIACIGEAARYMAQRSIVKGKVVATLPAFRKSMMQAGADWQRSGLETSGNLITAGEETFARRLAVEAIRLLRKSAGR